MPSSIGQNSSNELNFDHLTIDDGLSHNSIHVILQDTFGYIWIGTQNGLNKYDGYTLKVYRSNASEKDKHGFVGLHISALFEDRQGQLWVGTRKHGINLKLKSSDRFINLKNDPEFASIFGFDISSIYEDQEGFIWISTVGGGIVKYNVALNKAINYTTENSGLSSNLCFDVIEDKQGVIWVATAGGGLNLMLEEGRFELSHEMLPNHPNIGGYRKKLLLDGDDLWIATQGTGLYKMDIHTRDYIHFAPGNGKRAISSNGVRAICKTDQGQLFIATDGAGLNIYDISSEEIRVHTHKGENRHALNSNSLFCMEKDRKGNIWIGTFNGGINIYKPYKTWFEMLQPTGESGMEKSYSSVLSVLERRNGRLLVGTDGEGLHINNTTENDAADIHLVHDPRRPNSLAGNVIKTIFEDSQEKVWIGMFGAGLDLYNPDKKSFKHVLTGPFNVWSIAERKNGQLLIGTMGNGIQIMNPKTLELSPFEITAKGPNNLDDQNVMTLFVDADGNTWIGYADNGIDVINANNEHIFHFQHHTEDSLSLSNNTIRSIFQDNRGKIWIGTEGGGLNRWKGSYEFEWIRMEDGLISNSVVGITEDQEGSIWVSSFEGLSKIDQKNHSIRNFDFRSEAHSNQFNQQAIASNSNGKLYFGGIYGLHSIYPDQVFEKENNYKLTFTDFKIYNESISVGKSTHGNVVLESPIEQCSTVWLHYLDKSFTIEFSSMDFSSHTIHELTYKLEGFDTEWQSLINAIPSVTYTNLDPGSYTFIIKLGNSETALQIYMEAPFWEKLWFRVLGAFLLLAVVSGAMYFWNRRKEIVHKRKILQLQNEKLATEIEAKNSKLMFTSVQMAHKNEILTDIKKRLQGIRKDPSRGYQSIVNKLDFELKNEDYWKEFDLYFNQVDQKFVDSIYANFPNLTKNDVRLCSFLRLKLSTKEIASLFNISPRAIEQARYRLKKRLGLSKSDDLATFILNYEIGDR